MADSKRSEINRQNAQKSTGPKTAEGKARSRRNALKHGLRAEVLPLPNEDPAAIQARADAWNDYFRPRNPAEQHLVDECVRATILSDRCHRAQDAIVARRVREAEAKYEHEREDEVERLWAAFKDDPAGAVRGSSAPPAAAGRCWRDGAPWARSSGRPGRGPRPSATRWCGCWATARRTRS